MPITYEVEFIIKIPVKAKVQVTDASKAIDKAKKKAMEKPINILPHFITEIRATRVD